MDNLLAKVRNDPELSPKEKTELLDSWISEIDNRIMSTISESSEIRRVAVIRSKIIDVKKAIEGKSCN